jgi:putative ABC transport system permease protein
MWQDVKFALRTLRKNPAFTLVAMLALALGIGANSAIFSVVDALALRPLPFPQPEELVSVTSGRNGDGPASIPDFVDWRAQSKTLAKLAAWNNDTYILTGRKKPLLLNGITGSADLFAVAGVAPLYGRTFGEGEAVAGKNHVAVVSWSFWQKQLGGEKEAIGQTLTLDGDPYTVIGVMPRGFRFPFGDMETDLWAPQPHGMDAMGAKNRGAHYLNVTGRLVPGATLEQARAEMATIQNRLAQSYPNEDAGRFIKVRTLSESLLWNPMVGDLRPALFVLLGAVGFVLLIACANVANLLLARATVRQREIAIRTALGAGRGRVIRQMLTESVLLSVAGGALGLVIALWGVDALVALIPANVPRPHDIVLDGRVVGFTAGIAVATGLLFGLIPALHAVRESVQAGLSGSSRSVAHGHSRARGALLIGEIAVAMVLLVGAGLLLRSFASVLRVDPGFNPRDLLVASVPLPDNRYSKREVMRDFYTQLKSRLESLPGVKGIVISMPFPYERSDISLTLDLDDRPAAPPGKPYVAAWRTVNPEYFQTMGIRVLQGRGFEKRDDDPHGPQVMVVNETFARTYWPNGGALGRKVKAGISEDVFREIVGVVADVRSELSHEARAEMYEPFGQQPENGVYVAVRAPHAGTYAHSIAQAVAEVDPDQPVTDIATMEDNMAASLGRRRITMVLLAIFAILALVLAAVGIYGVMSYSVTQRTRELGIRMALGAQRREVLGMVVSQGMRAAVIGVGLGMVGALALTRVMASLLFGVSPTDPLTFAGIGALLLVVATLASFLPARRATRVDPMIALRGE